MSTDDDGDLVEVMAAVRAAANVGTSVLVLRAVSERAHVMAMRTQRTYRVDGLDGVEVPRWQSEHIRNLVVKGVVALGDQSLIRCGGERFMVAALVIPARTHELMPTMAMHAVSEMARTSLPNGAR